MTDALPQNDTRRRLIETAEELFAARGYASVTLRDIAQAVGLKHGSLYYYIPGGKEALFVEVLEHSCNRHRGGLSTAIAQAGDDVHAQLDAIADWFTSTPAISLEKIQQGDRPDLTAHELHRLASLAFESLSQPIAAALSAAAASGDLHVQDTGMAAMVLISAVQSTRTIPNLSPAQRTRLGRDIVAMMLTGWLPR